MDNRKKEVLDSGLICFAIYYIGLCLVSLGMVFPIASIWSNRWLTSIPLIAVVLGLLSFKKNQDKISLGSHLTPVESNCLLLWICFSLFAVVFSDHFAAALVRQVEWFVQVGFSILFGYFFGKYSRFPRYIIFTISLGFLLVVVVFISKWQVTEEPHHYDWMWNPPVFFHLRHLNYLAVACFSTAFYWFFSSVKRFDIFWWISFVLIVLSISTISWSGARSGLFVVFIVSAFLLFSSLLEEKQKKSDLFLFISISIFCGWLVSEWLWTTSDGMGISFFHGKSVDELTLHNFSSGRLETWGQVVASLYGNSSVFGYGPDGFLYMDGKPTNEFHPHNFYLQALGEWGIGAVPFFVLNGLIMVRTGRYIYSRRLDSRYTTLVTAWIFCLSYLILGFFTGPFYHAWSLAFFFLFFGVLLSANKELNEGNLPNLSGVVLQALINSRFLWLVGLFVMSLHMSVNVAQMGPVPESPNSVRAKLVKAFPSHNIVLGSWYDQWIRNNPSMTLEGLHWLQKHSITNSAWKYYVEEGNYFREQGKFSKAMALYDIAVQKAPVNLKEADLEALESLRKGLPSSVE